MARWLSRFRLGRVRCMKQSSWEVVCPHGKHTALTQLVRAFGRAGNRDDGMEISKPPLVQPLRVTCYIDSGGRACVSRAQDCLPGACPPKFPDADPEIPAWPSTLGTALPSVEKMQKQSSSTQSRLERTRNLMVGAGSHVLARQLCHRSPPLRTQTFTE